MAEYEGPVKPSVGWCRDCNIPITTVNICPACGSELQKLKLSGGEIKPLFEKERKFYQTIVHESLGSNAAKLLDTKGFFCSRNGELVVDGQKIIAIRYNRDSNRWLAHFMKSFEKKPFEPVGCELEKVISINSSILNDKEDEAKEFLMRVKEEYESLPLLVSFSGGKDSIATLNIVRAIQKKTKAIFLNTTIEFPETVQYTREVCSELDIELKEVIPESDFLTLANSLGPPSRIMRWCCKTQKFGPLNKYLADIYPDGLLMASGVRMSESNSRSKFDQIQINPNVQKQILVFPVLKWNSFDIWLYILGKKLRYNPIYENGYSRVGCWACPEKSKRDAALVDQSHPYLAEKLVSLLRRFGESRELSDVEDWISSGTWRQWRTKWQHTIGCFAQMCSQDKGRIYQIEDKDHMKRVNEFLKILGPKKNFSFGSITNGNGLRITTTGTTIRVVINDDKSKSNFEKQIARALNCVGCGACVGACPVGALSIIDGEISISDQCNHCLACLKSTGIRMGCIALNYRPDILAIDSIESFATAVDIPR